MFGCVSDVLGLVDPDDIMPTAAILVYRFVDRDGSDKVDYVVSNTLGTTDVVGMAHFVREDAIRDLFDQDGHAS